MPAQLDIIPNARITPSRIGKGFVSGAVYDSAGNLAKLSERTGGLDGDQVISRNEPRIDPERFVAKRLKGRWLYLGHHMGFHFGHVITEMAGTFWVFDQHEASQFDGIVFHPFLFGSARTPWVRMLFETFGITPDRTIVVGNQALIADELWIPERLFILNASGHPLLKPVYGKLVEKAVSQCPNHYPKMLYLSRRGESYRGNARSFPMERQIERLFKSQGYAIVHPERMPVIEQIALASQAVELAGFAGSALHLALFMEAGGRVIELTDGRYGDRLSPTQRVCGELSGIAQRHVIGHEGVRVIAAELGWPDPETTFLDWLDECGITAVGWAARTYRSRHRVVQFLRMRRNLT